MKLVLSMSLIVIGSGMLVLGLQNWLPETLTPFWMLVLGMGIVAGTMYLNSVDMKSE
ncbi:MAG: hypothetical protein RBR02_09530 [Desulfuromonadaceae bacterium]|nr:hypothetical protein [Desulfuromonadaceae bacterium]